MDFNPLSSDFFDDPYTTYRWLRDEAPAYYNEQFGFWALSRYDDVVSAHRDWKTFSSEHGVTIDQLTDPDSPVRSSSMIMMDPPEHEVLRKLVSRVFTPRAVEALEPMVRAVVQSHLDPLRDRDNFDLVAEFSAPFPVEVISTMLGVPEPDRQQIRHWTDLLLHREPNDPSITHAGMEAALLQVGYFLDLIKDKRATPGDDLIDRLITVEFTGDDGATHRLSDGEIAGFAGLLAAAGSETVTKLIGNGVVLFDRFPDQYRLLVDDRSKTANAVEEILRYWAPSQYQGRFSQAPSVWHDVTIPEEMPVLLITGAANRDERAYDDPDRFAIDRVQPLAVGLGHGIHACLGAALARLESRIAFDEIADRWPDYTVEETGLRRVQMANVAGFSNVPVRAAA